jgi:hypothetical protein
VSNEIQVCKLIAEIELRAPGALLLAKEFTISNVTNLKHLPGVESRAMLPMNLAQTSHVRNVLHFLLVVVHGCLFLLLSESHLEIQITNRANPGARNRNPSTLGSAITTTKGEHGLVDRPNLLLVVAPAKLARLLNRLGVGSHDVSPSALGMV